MRKLAIIPAVGALLIFAVLLEHRPGDPHGLRKPLARAEGRAVPETAPSLSLMEEASLQEGAGATDGSATCALNSVGVSEEEMAMPGEALAEDVWIHEGDADGDGLRDDFERAHGFDPEKADSFGDGVADEDRIAPGGRTQMEGEHR